MTAAVISRARVINRRPDDLMAGIAPAGPEGIRSRQPNQRESFDVSNYGREAHDMRRGERYRS
jgi:hypothetical protein